jgi:small Trp-rich protein
MIFILLGVLLLTLKLGGVHPVSDWAWFSIAIPFLLAIVWFEVLEPLLGLDAKRQQMLKRKFEGKVAEVDKKKPRQPRRGSPFK